MRAGARLPGAAGLSRRERPDPGRGRERVNRPAVIVGGVLLVALAVVTAVGEYVRWNLPSGDDKLAMCRAIPPGASVTEVVAVLGQPVARQMADLAEDAVWLEFGTPSIAAGRIRAAVHESSGKVLTLRCTADGPDTWAAQE